MIDLAETPDTAQSVEVACPVCLSSAYNLATVRNGFAVVKCKKCSCLLANPRPSEESLIRLYQDYPKIVENLGGEVRDNPEDSRREAQYHVRHLSRFVRGGRLLDLGCGSGDLLEIAQAAFDVCGVDVAPRLRRGSKSLTVFEGRLEDAAFESASFNAVTAVEVIEHLFDPRRTLEEIHRVLMPGGMFLVQTGDAGSLPARLGLDRWSYVQPPVHLNFFTRKTLVRLLRQTGFQIRGGWSFGRAPGRLPIVRRLRTREYLRPLLNLASDWGILGQMYVAVRTSATQRPSHRSFSEVARNREDLGEEDWKHRLP